MTPEAAPLPLGELVERIAPLVVLGDPEGMTITAVVHHHDQAGPGALFCCLPGSKADGHTFAAEALRRGATAFVCEHSLPIKSPGAGAVQLVVGPGRARQAMAQAACALWRDPSRALKTVGVTGTNGKTTVTYLLREIFERHGWPTGVIGTLDGARTTPEAPELQRSLAAQLAAGCVASALEVTSHALVQERVDGICFDVAVFTNLSQDHLDYHETMEAYFEAKAELFTSRLCRRAVVNLDDQYGRRLLDRATVPTTGFSCRDAAASEVGLHGSSFQLLGRTLRFGLGGRFNIENALAAAHTAVALGVPEDTIVEALADAHPVPGRLELVPSGDGVTVVVDFAHTPAGLAQLLATVRTPRGGIGAGEGGAAQGAVAQGAVAQGGAAQGGAAQGGAAEGALARGASCTGRGALIVVFGCGGDRDRGKRPAMGKVASELADVVVLTSDNPRSEDPRSIIDQIRAGLRPGTDYVVQPDRRAAITEALRRAVPGDVVVLAGKGHETTQEIGGQVLAFDDRDVARQELARLGRAVRRTPGAARSA
jgi:UDP-N-acetylmuramoyl-L-alanyl-D-glutamate--2,6-diaminopimelate ligase